MSETTCDRHGHSPPECKFCDREAAFHALETAQDEEDTHWVLCPEHEDELPSDSEVLHRWRPTGECDKCGREAVTYGISTIHTAGEFCSVCADEACDRDLDADVTGHPLLQEA